MATSSIDVGQRHLHYPENDDLRGICMLFGVTTHEELQERISELPEDEIRGVATFFHSTRDAVQDQLYWLSGILAEMPADTLSREDFLHFRWIIRGLTTQADAAKTLANMADNLGMMGKKAA